MKIPSSIQICGVKYKVKQDPNSAGGSFDSNTATIVIGTAVKHEIPDTIIHEVIEAVFAIRNMRYIRQVPEPDNGDYVFVFNHEDWHKAVADITAALKGLNFK